MPYILKHRHWPLWVADDGLTHVVANARQFATSAEALQHLTDTAPDFVTLYEPVEVIPSTIEEAPV